MVLQSCKNCLFKIVRAVTILAIIVVVLIKPLNIREVNYDEY